MCWKSIASLMESLTLRKNWQIFSSITRPDLVCLIKNFNLQFSFHWRSLSLYSHWSANCRAASWVHWHFRHNARHDARKEKEGPRRWSQKWRRSQKRRRSYYYWPKNEKAQLGTWDQETQISREEAFYCSYSQWRWCRRWRKPQQRRQLTDINIKWEILAGETWPIISIIYTLLFSFSLIY